MKLTVQKDNVILQKVEIKNSLDKGFYSVHYNDRTEETYLIEQSAPVLPDKIYGNNIEFTTKLILEDFKKGSKNLGVCLSGIKGTGKTLLANNLSIKADVPVLMINQYINVSKLMEIITSNITKGIIIYVDEFEKLYKDEAYEQWLSVLDGNISSKILFIFTTNSHYMPDFLNNRPSRVKYAIKYTYLTDELRLEIIEDLLINKDHAEDLIKITKGIKITTDVLISIINVMNKFNLPYSNFKDIFNFEYDQTTDYVMRIYEILEDNSLKYISNQIEDLNEDDITEAYFYFTNSKGEYKDYCIELNLNSCECTNKVTGEYEYIDKEKAVKLTFRARNINYAF